MGKNKSHATSTHGGGPIYYSLNEEALATLSRFVVSAKAIIIILMVVSVCITGWRWSKHSALEYKTTHLGLRDDNSAKCRAALGGVRLNDDDDNSDYCILAEYYGDFRYWAISFVVQLLVLLGLVATSLDVRRKDQNINDEVTTNNMWGVYSRYIGIAGTVRNVGFYDADYHFWLCRILTDGYIGAALILNVGGLDAVYAYFSCIIMGTYAFAGFVREASNATHTFEDNDMWWNRYMARPFMHLPQLAIFIAFFVVVFDTVYLEFCEHNTMRTIVNFSFWLPFGYYLMEQVVVAVWLFLRARNGVRPTDDVHVARKYVILFHYVSYFLMFCAMAVAPGWMMYDFRYAI